MFRTLLVGAAVVMSSVTLARADEKADVEAAAQKLADSSYSWKTTIDGGFGPSGSEGKTEKDGYTHVSMAFRDNTTEIVKKGEKVAIKTEDGWKTAEEAEQDSQQGPGRFIGMMARNLRTPVDTTRQLAKAAKEWKKDGDAVSGQLSEEGAKEMVAFGRRGGQGGQGPEYSDLKGDAQIWLKDGAVSKIKYHVTGKVSFNGNDRDIDRTTTIEVKDVGSTKVEVPAEAKAKLG